MHERYRGERVSTQLLSPQETAGTPVRWIRQPRVAIIPLLATGLLLISALVLFFHVQSFLERMETRLVAADRGGDARLRAIGRQVEVLRGKLHGALAESVEIRIRELEKNIDAGKLSAGDFKAFDELQRDLKLLEDYAENAPTSVFDYTARDHGRFRPISPKVREAYSTPVRQEFSDLKTLFYFCLAGFGTSTVMMVGYYWTVQRRDVRRIRAATKRLPAVPYS